MLPSSEILSKSRDSCRALRVQILIVLGEQNCEKGFFYKYFHSITAIISTEGAAKSFPIWDVFREFPVSPSVLHQFTRNPFRSLGIIRAQLVIETNG